MGLERGELEVLDGHDATSFDPVEFEVHHSVRRRTADGSQCQGGLATGLSAGDGRGMVRGEVMAEEPHEPKKPCWRFVKGTNGGQRPVTPASRKTHS